MIRESYNAGIEEAFEKIAMYTKEEYQALLEQHPGYTPAVLGGMGALAGGALSVPKALEKYPMKRGLKDILLRRRPHLVRTTLGKAKTVGRGALALGVPLAALGAGVDYLNKAQAKRVLSQYKKRDK